MKKQILLFFLITFANFIFSQTDTLFFDKDWKKCIRSDAEFYRLITRSGTDYIVKDSYINNKPQMIAVCSVLEPLIKDGKCTFYDKNGLRTKTGTYNNN